MTFMSAKELGIPENHREALIKTLVHLESGCSVHRDINDRVANDHFLLSNNDARLTKDKIKTPIEFNMSTWSSYLQDQKTGHPCGTVCCIGGTAEMLGNVNFDSIHWPDELHILFCPNGIQTWNTITVEHGAQALRNYLTYGHPNWEEVMK